MIKREDKRLSISEASEKTGVAPHLLRQWESRFPQLKPKRNRAGQRYYTARDLDIVQRIKHYLWHERMTTQGARLRLAEELHGRGRPKTSTEALELLKRIEAEVIAMLDQLGRT